MKAFWEITGNIVSVILYGWIGIAGVMVWVQTLVSHYNAGNGLMVVIDLIFFEILIPFFGIAHVFWSIVNLIF